MAVADYDIPPAPTVNIEEVTAPPDIEFAGGLNVGTGSIQSEEVYCSDIHSTATSDNGTNSMTTGSLSYTSHDTILEFLVTIIEFLVLAGQILQGNLKIRTNSGRTKWDQMN